MAKRITTEKTGKEKKAEKTKVEPKSETVKPENSTMPEGKDPTTGRFVKGNRWWEARSKHGRDMIIENPEAMKEACLEYFVWVEENPLWENKVAQFQGAPVDMPVAKMRAMTVESLCIFLDISHKTWREYAQRADFIQVTEWAEQVIRSQKFAGAAADLFNANIIARDLGLKDESKHEHTGPGGGPIQSISKTISPEEAFKKYSDMVKS